MVVVKKKVLALGFFDCVHIGHRFLLEKAKQYAKLSNSELVVLTFSDVFLSTLNRNAKEVYTLKERQRLLKGLGCKSIIVMDENATFLDMSAGEFMSYLEGMNPCAIFAGEDYRFGAGAQGNMAMLKKFFNGRAGIRVFSVDLQTFLGQKISSSEIRQLLCEGNIKRANGYLFDPYSVTAQVVRGRGDGKKYGIPTANITVPEYKLMPGSGVYLTETTVGGRKYISLSNVGSHPTFEDNTQNIETVLLDFEGNLYGKMIKISFFEKLRDVRKFDSPLLLKEQIDKDIAYAKMHYKEFKA